MDKSVSYISKKFDNYQIYILLLKRAGVLALFYSRGYFDISVLYMARGTKTSQWIDGVIFVVVFF